MSEDESGADLLEPYVPRLAVSWLLQRPEARWQVVDGTLAFVDISGFTALTEQLARKGKVGAEEMSDILNAMFAALLAVAYRDGAGLVKWGGDAVLLLFEGEDHAARAAHATFGMREQLTKVGRIGRGPKAVTLRMSVGIHSGTFHFFLVGDPAIHRELLISGPAASRTAKMEALASADEIGLTPEAAALLPAASVGEPLGDGYLLASAPDFAADALVPRTSIDGVDIASLLPPPIREHLRAARGESEHRRIAVAFVQFAGTDALLAREGPEALADALDEFVRVVQRATAKYGVTFFESDINADGGKIMLTAGAPVSGDHHEERMLRAAIEIVGRIGRLPVRIGLNRGDVFSGDFGPEFRRTYSVMGDAINLAARLLGKAEPGQVVATRRALDASTVEFEVEPLAPFLVKGKTDPINAARVGRPIEAMTERVEPESFVGREREMRALREALETAAGGHGLVVELVGEPGIGKSRLATEAWRGVGIRTLTARGDDYEATTPYWPFRSLLRDVLGVAPDADDPTVVAALTERAAIHAPALMPWLPLVANVMDVDMPSTPEVESLADEFRKPRREEVTAQLVVAAIGTPSALVVDDAHLLDDASVDLLERLCRDVVDTSRLVLVMRRDVDRGFRPSADYPVTTLRPEPLDASASAELVRRALADAAVTSHDIATITQRAAGNPLFLRGLIEAARTGDPVDSLPDTVEALITSQIDQLPPDERTVLRFASVLGMDFDGAELRSLLRDRPLPTGPDSLKRLSYFIRPEQHGQYRFEHQLMRDTAYEGLPYRLRRDLHGRAADLLEATAPDTDDVAEVLSLHYLEAKRPDKAWHYARLAGDRAARKYAQVEAEQLYSRAVRAARGLRGVSDADKSQVYLALSESQQALGRSEAALASLRAARTRSKRDPLTCARLSRREATLNRMTGDYTRARRSAGRGIRLLEGHDDPASLASLSELEVALANICLLQGRSREGLSWAERAQSHATASGDVTAEADAAATMYGQLVNLGTPDRTYGETALRLYEALGDRVQQAFAVVNLAVLSWMEGRGEEALEMFRQAYGLALEAGDTYSQGSAAANIGDALLQLGRPQEAEEVLRRALPDLRAARMNAFLSVTERSLGLALVAQDRIEEGVACIEAARDLQESLGDREELAETEVARAWTSLTTGEAGEAATIGRGAVARCEELEADYALPKALRVLGAALVDLDEADEADEVLRRALEIADAQAPVERGFILAELATLAERGGQADEAARLRRESTTAFDLLGFVGSARYPRG